MKKRVIDEVEFWSVEKDHSINEGRIRVLMAFIVCAGIILIAFIIRS